MMYDLPHGVEVSGTWYEADTDYRTALNILTALADPELGEREKVFVTLHNFYPAFTELPHEHYREAVELCFWFLRGGEENDGKNSPRLMDWEQDFRYIVAPINRVAGCDVRSVPYLHWWTFLSYYYEIGDCLFAQIVRIRDKKARGRALDMQDREFYHRNRELVDLRTRYTAAEDDLVKQWTGG